MNNKKWYVAVSLIGALVLAGCSNTNTFDGTYVINKQRTSNSADLKELEQLSPMMVDLKKMLFGVLVEAMPMVLIKEGVVRVGVATCDVSSGGDLDCGGDAVSGRLEKTGEGVALLIKDDDGNDMRLEYDRKE